MMFGDGCPNGICLGRRFMEGRPPVILSTLSLQLIVPMVDCPSCLDNRNSPLMHITFRTIYSDTHLFKKEGIFMFLLRAGEDGDALILCDAGYHNDVAIKPRKGSDLKN